jgi:hypothetical protein
MEKEYGPSEEFIEYILQIQNDKVYQNEILPAECFIDSYDEVKKEKLLKNENDPPDFFIEGRRGNKICLEVTSLGADFTFKYNSFIKITENNIRKHLELNIKLLPVGFYGVFFVPSSQDFVETRMGKIQIADFSNIINREQLDEYLLNNMAQFLINYAIGGKQELSVMNRKGDQVGVISIIKFGEADKPQFKMLQQQYRRLSEWKESELSKTLQEIIEGKECKYHKADINGKLKDLPWWLLISDIHDLMGTSGSSIDYTKVIVSYKFFDKVFLISPALKGHQIVKL